MFRIFKSKTICASSVVAVLGAIQAFTPLFKDILTPEAYGYFLVIVGGVFAVIRNYTDKPLSEVIRSVADAVAEVEKQKLDSTDSK